MKKPIRSALLLLLSALFLFSGCAKPESNSNNGVTVTNSLIGKPVLVGNIPCSFPLVSESTSLNVMACASGPPV